ncbi:Crp/Fnr family transcriptional regulator [Sphingomonas sp. PB4P5]|uniref:Crp/Fnr family transcriptional regulator n=1 Tax=Parasphingomonas puruogangriensis TaxID=3096155 RepID=UPI002FC918BE
MVERSFFEPGDEIALGCSQTAEQRSPFPARGGNRSTTENPLALVGGVGANAALERPDRVEPEKSRIEGVAGLRWFMAHKDLCTDCAVRDEALCGSLNNEELGALNTIGRRQLVARGETVIWAGDESIICANLRSGVLKIVASTSDGREQIVGLLYPADFVGQAYAGLADFTITALTDAELCVFSRAAFQRVLEDHGRMERLLLQRTLAALSAARGRMLSLARKSAEEKIADFLLEMALHATSSGCRATPDGPLTFDLPLTRGQIGAILGLTIETVSRQMTRLKGAGVIGLPGGRAITISDRTALELRAQAA